MASDLTIPETHDIAAWVAAIKLIDTDEPVIGGIDGISNAQAIQLAKRTRWLKAVIGQVVAAADGVDPGTGNLDQLLEAIQAIVAAALADVDLTVDPASETAPGIAELATEEEAVAGVDIERIVTPVTLAAAMLASLGPGGTSLADYVTIPFRDRTTGVRRNLIVQWVTGSPVSAGELYTLPIAFPNAALGAFACVAAANFVRVYCYPSGLSQVFVRGETGGYKMQMLVIGW